MDHIASKAPDTLTLESFQSFSDKVEEIFYLEKNPKKQMASLETLIKKTDTVTYGEDLVDLLFDLREWFNIEDIYGKLRRQFQSFVSFLIKRIPYKDLPSDIVTRAFYALNKIPTECVIETHLEIMLTELDKRTNLSDKSLYTILKAICRTPSFKVKDFYAEKFFELLEQQEINWKKCPIEGVIQLYSLYQRDIPKNIQREFDWHRMEIERTPSSFEEEAMLAINRLYRELSLNEEIGSFYINLLHKSGYELDVFIPKISLNIELDGPHHYQGRRKDVVRDNFLLVHYGITVIRITLKDIQNRDLEEIIAEIIKEQTAAHSAKKENGIISENFMKKLESIPAKLNSIQESDLKDFAEAIKGKMGRKALGKIKRAYSDFLSRVKKSLQAIQNTDKKLEQVLIEKRKLSVYLDTQCINGQFSHRQAFQNTDLYSAITPLLEFTK